MATLELADLLATEHNGWHSLTEGTGGGFYGTLMTDDALMVLVNGDILTRDQVAASLDDAPPWSRYEIADAQVVPLGPDVAALIYRASALRGTEDTFRAVMTSTYRLVDGRLRLALYQQTTITH